MASQAPAIPTSKYTWQHVLPAAWALGGVILAIYAAAIKSWQAFGYGLAVAAAATMVGGLVGFLFGIPRADSDGASSSDTFKSNTNLVQISDWLTKIIVGVGLVQIARGPSALARLSHSLAGGLGKHAASPAFGLSIVIFFAATGFLYLYLWSQLDLIRELRNLDLTTLIKPVLDAAGAVAQEALTLVERTLRPSAGAAAPTQAELNDAIAKTTDLIRQQAQDSAESVRRNNWKSEPTLMARSIPVFQALIAADTAHVNHRAHGSLGFAFKDQLNHDWQQARTELTTAITMRGTPASDKGWAVYEMNRALCLINLDAGFNAQPRVASTPENAQLIVADLTVASMDSFAKFLLGKPDVHAWLAVNPDAPGVDPTWIDVHECD